MMQYPPGNIYPTLVERKNMFKGALGGDMSVLGEFFTQTSYKCRLKHFQW